MSNWGYETPLAELGLRAWDWEDREGSSACLSLVAWLAVLRLVWKVGNAGSGTGNACGQPLLISEDPFQGP